MLMKANKNGKKISWEYFYLYKSWMEEDRAAAQQQADTVQEMYILLYTALHCTALYIVQSESEVHKPSSKSTDN